MSVRGRLKRSSFFIRITGKRDMVRIISTDKNRGKTQFGKQDFITIWQHEACRVVPDCDFMKLVFLSTPHTYLRDPFRIVFFLHTFQFWKWIFLNAVICWRLPYCDDITLTFSDVIMFSNVSINDGLCDVLYNQCTPNTWVFLIFTLPAWEGQPR